MNLETKKALVYSLALSVLVILAFTFLSMWRFGSLTWQLVGAGMLALEIIYIYFGFSQRQVFEVYALFLFGDPLGDLKKKGLLWVVLWIIKVDKEDGQLKQNELPADPEKVFDGDGKIPEGMVPPIRILFGPPDTSDHTIPLDSPYNKQMVVSVVVVISRRITSLTNYRTTLKDGKNEMQILTDRSVATFANKFATMTPAKALKELDTINAELKTALKEISITENWGIEITEAYVKPFNFSHALNKAVVQVSVSELTAKSYSAEQTAIIEKQREWLIETGQAEIDPVTKKITKLIPDAHSKIWAEAIKELSKLTGTIVFGGEDLKTMLNIGTSSSNVTMPLMPKPTVTPATPTTTTTTTTP